MISILKNYVTQHPFQAFFWISFAFTATAALSIQIVLLPYFFPHLHAGHGLLVGGDWVGFHQLAVNQWEEILRFGWDKWQLAPAGHAQVGIASIFYAVFVPEPWVLIPFNALVHAISALLLARMLFMISGRAWISIAGAIPFLVYPSSAMWYSQLHKEGFYFFGYFLCLYGWMRLCQSTETQCIRKSSFGDIVLIFLGVLIIGLIRDFGAKLVVLMGFLFSVAMSVRLLAATWPLPIWRVSVTILILFAIPLATNEYSSNHYFDAGLSGIQKRIELHQAQSISQTHVWTNSLRVPDQIDAQFAAISHLRRAYLAGSPGAKSEIDPGLDLGSINDFLKYLPRAVQVGFLAPFPKDWVADGNLPVTTMMRRFTSAEMIFAYLGFCFLPYILWRQRQSLNMWLFFSINLLIVLLYTYVVPNIGTLYRMRYGFFMSLVALGVVGVAFAIETLRLRRIARLD